MLHTESKYHVEGTTFLGFFNIPADKIRQLEQVSESTGVNAVDYYVEVIHCSWSHRFPNCWYEYDQYNALTDKISFLRKHRLITPEIQSDAAESLRVGLSAFKEWYESRINQPRIEANRYIARTDVRREVFSIHGRNCLDCGTNKSITLDHVIPVCIGGENTIDNLQPLCKKCNSKKGTTTKDFRYGRGEE